MILTKGILLRGIIMLVHDVVHVVVQNSHEKFFYVASQCRVKQLS